MGKNLLRAALVFLIIFIASVSIRGNWEKGKAIKDQLVIKGNLNDSSLINTKSLKHYASSDVHEFDNKDNKQSPTSLNSVNLIIYMIYRVTNKSLR